MRNHDDDRALLTITTTPVGDASLVAVSGEIDTRTAPELQAELHDVLTEHTPPRVVVDLTAVTFLGSAGLAVLVEANQLARRHDRDLALVVDHFTTAVTQPLQTAGLAWLITSYSVLDESSTGTTPRAVD